MKKILFISLIFAAVRDAGAYLDPGTGFTFATGFGALVWGFLALIFGAVVVTFKKWKEFLKRLFRPKIR